jgi:hypothetical protein
MQYDFEWDPAKARSNYRKHKVSFERATGIFIDPFALSLFDGEHSKEEDRWITIGKDRNDVPLVVVHTFKEINTSNSNLRLISARKATKIEVKQYSQFQR